MKNKFKRMVFLTVGMVSVGQLYAQNSVITGSRSLRSSGEIIEVTDADRIPITGGSASSFQPNMNIDKSYDKDYTTLYHSKWGVKNITDTLRYNFEVSTVTTLVYTSRTDDSENGNFKKFTLWALPQTGTSDKDFIKIGEYDFGGIAGSHRIDFTGEEAEKMKSVKSLRFIVEPGIAGLVSCAEMAFYRKNPEVPASVDGIGEITITGGEASSEQDANRAISKSYDRKFSSNYHSTFQNTQFPVTLNYYFEPVNVKKIICFTRVSGTNGNFKEFDLYTLPADGNDPVLLGSYDFKGLSGIYRIDLTREQQILATDSKGIRFVIKSGQNNLVSCAEMAFYGDHETVKPSAEINSETQIDKNTDYDTLVVTTPEAGLTVAPSVSLTAETLTLPVAADGQAARIELAEGATLTTARLTVEKTIPATGIWYFMAMPFDLNTENIKIKSTGNPAVLEQDIRLLTYDAKSRADGQMDQVWQTLTAPAVLAAHTGFAIQISSELAAQHTSLQFISSGEVSVTGANLEKTLVNHTSENELDRFVNFIGIPYLSEMGSQGFYVTSHTNCVALYQYDSQQDLYHTRLYTDETETAIRPYEALFMQASDQNDKLTYNYLHTPIVKAVAVPYPRIEVKMDNDRASLVFDENASSDFRINEDGIKMPAMNLATPMLYIQSTDGKALSVSVEPETERTVKLGVRPGTAGEHTISLGSSTSYQATAIELYDALTDVHTDLLKDSYTFTAGQTGDQKDRFSLRIIKAPTALNEAPISEANIYLNAAGELTVCGTESGTQIDVIDTQGRIVESRISEGHTLTLHTGTGLYLVRIGDKVRKVMR